MPLFANPADLFDSSRDTPAQTTVCVIGSGFCGALIAVDLAMAGIDVLVLESGSSDPDHRIDAMLDRVQVSGRTELNFGFSRQLGGASNLWAGRVAPFEPIDLERREWVPHSGWPISMSDLEAGYVRAGKILGLPGYTTAHGDGFAPPAFVSTDRIELKPFAWASKPFHAGQYLRDAVASTDRLRVLLNAPVVRLVERENARSVEAAVIALPGGVAARVQAQHFVIAAGGIQTPRLLLNSTDVRSAGIGNDHGAVGRYLSTHPKANVATLVLKKPVATRHPLFSDQPVAGGVIRCGVGFSAASQREFRLLNHYVQILPFAEYRANRLFEAFRGSEAFNSPLIDRSRLISGFVP
ncbi:MAG TPA: GMC family oxidoreductase N-terminal domain-containing protein, partial [Candidatus Krumholzibacteria bacterium]|nr:GMC family oxidoreductase N-terminal domain-containing protein [Candidatus Krumholzibacteria bacterium]